MISNHTKKKRPEASPPAVFFSSNLKLGTLVGITNEVRWVGRLQHSRCDLKPLSLS